MSNAQAWQAASERLERAANKLKLMESAPTIDALADAWSEFLTEEARFHNKLAKAIPAGPGKGWLDKIVHQRRSDDLLKYVMHARNADEHGIERITAAQPSSTGINFANPRNVSFTFDRGRIITDQKTARGMTIIFNPATIILIPVTDRGVVYAPPSEHLGAPIASQSPIEVARIVLGYCSNIYEDGRKQFGG